jgi:hypothetical protein
MGIINIQVGITMEWEKYKIHNIHKYIHGPYDHYKGHAFNPSKDNYINIRYATMHCMKAIWIQQMQTTIGF